MKNYYVCYRTVFYGHALMEVVESFKHPEVNDKNIGEFKIAFEARVKDINASFSNILIISWQEVKEV